MLKSNLRPQKEPSWMFEEGLRIRSFHEPLNFLRMRGGCGDNEKLTYDFLRSKTYIDDFVEKGFNHIWLNWFKGYGLKAEKSFQDQVIALIPYCKEKGLRVGCYVTFGSLTFDTMLLEEPDVVNWIAKTQMGQPTSCQVTHQCFRYRPCFSSEGYLSYIEKVVSRCLDAGADGIHFDNIGMQAEPEACHCERCTNLFREFLQKEYGGDLGEEIFGFNDFSKATVPWFNQHNTANKLSVAKSQHQRTWIDFKCQTFSSAVNRLADYIHQYKKGAFVEVNGSENDGFAAGFWRGNDLGGYLSKIDIFCDEGNRQDGLNKKGAIVGEYRAKKWARAFGCPLWSENTPRGIAADLSDDPALSFAPFGFWKKYKQYQLKAESRTRVAVLRERNSLTYNRWEPWEETLAMEQYLIESHIPFDFVHNGQLKNISEVYQLLIVAGAEVISNEIRDLIQEFIKKGGSVLLTGETGVYDEYYRERRQHLDQIRSMEDYFLAHKRLNAFHDALGYDDPKESENKEIKSDFGKGRIAWFEGPQMDRMPHTPDYWAVSPEILMMPNNFKQIDCLLEWLLPEGFEISIKTNEKVYLHTTERVDTGEVLVHLINHEFPQKEAVVNVSFQSDRMPLEVVSISTDDKENGYEEKVELFSYQDNLINVTVSSVRVHRILVIRF